MAMKRVVSTILALCFLFSAFLLTPATALAMIRFDSEPDWLEAENIYQAEAVPAYQGIAPLSASFSQEEIDDPDMWYAVPERVVTLAATPANTAYTRLLAEIGAAPANMVTHIMIPFHINTGNIGANTSVVELNSDATVVLIGNHTSASSGQIVISDTHEGNVLSQAFRVRGTSHERTALVFRNIMLQKSRSATQGTPATAPAPLALSAQTGNSRGGGIAIEDSEHGGGQVILCRGSIIRHTSTNNRGPVDVQTNGRFIMMPGSEMYNNKAENAGGAVHVGPNATFHMYGGLLRNNIANGVNTSTPLERGVGGAVIVRGGTFHMHGGEIHNNEAIHSGTTVSATNAIGTSNGGGVFVIGSESAFYMHGGRIRNNEARRTDRASNVTTATNRAAFRSGNGGGVYLSDGATFHMYGGYIHGNLATATGTAASSSNGGNALNLSNGGGVYLTGAGTTFHMHGGEIHNNTAHREVNSAPTMGGTNAMQVFAGNGGGVHVFDGAAFNMTGGEIFKNITSRTTARPENNAANAANISNGGGVFVAGADSAFTMSGGTIRDNEVTGGPEALPNVSISGNGGGVALRNGARFTMNAPDDEAASGKIMNNKADMGGGGVFVSGVAAVFEMNAGTISENKAGNGAGVCVMGSGMFTLKDGEIRFNDANFDGGGVQVYGRAHDVSESSPTVASIVGGSFRMEGGFIEGNTARLLGGGVNIRQGGSTTATRVTFTMTGGEIIGNSTTGDGGGGVNVGENTFFRMEAGEIRENWTSGRLGGGGIFVSRGGDATIEGGEIRKNEARTAPHGSSFGGGIMALSNAHLTLQGGEISENLAAIGGGVHLEWASTLTMSAGAVISRNGFDPTGVARTTRGGGVAVGRGGTFTMHAGEINGNRATASGGGVYIDPSLIHPLNGGTGNAAFTMSSGTISHNIANDGGGLFVPHSNLNRISIANAATFSHNVARNGLRIDNGLAAAQRLGINPGTVSITDWALIDETSAGSNNFAEVMPHAFTNYDINSTGSLFWKVTYEVKSGEGDIQATVGANAFPVTSRALLPDGARMIFAAEPTERFDWWNIGERTQESIDGGSESEFVFNNGGTSTPLSHTVKKHTHVEGHFLTGFTITFDPNGGLGDPFVQWVPGGMHTLLHEVSHENIDGTPVQFMGWNTAADGSGTNYLINEHIDITEDMILYAQWNIMSTTLSISKTVTGEFGNRNMEFEFTIFFQDAEGRPLPSGKQFQYTGEAIVGSGNLAPANGTLILDDNGSAKFRLAHGQSICIEEIAMSGYIQIIETPNVNYLTSFTDSEHGDLITLHNDTTMLPVTSDRIFRFTNERIAVPATGIGSSHLGAYLLLPALVFLPALIIFAFHTSFRFRQKGRSPYLG